MPWTNYYKLDKEEKCPFCRIPNYTSLEEGNKLEKKRMEVDGDAIATHNHGGSVGRRAAADSLLWLNSMLLEKV